MPKLFTIGYEGTDIERFLDTLEVMGIEVLADVRQLPISRKKGFAKTKLGLALAERGIEYKHYKHLGDPKAGREAARAGNMEEFRTIFSNHFAQKEPQNALAELLKIAENKRTCMLCFERCASSCHRLIIADQAAAMGFNIYNLASDNPQKYVGNEENIPRYNPSQSLTAAE